MINKKFKENGPFGRLLHFVTQFHDNGETHLVYKWWRKRKRYWEYETQPMEIWKMRQAYARQYRKEESARKASKGVADA